MNVAALLDKAARTFTGCPAMSVGAKRYATYGELAHRVAALAGGLTSRLGLKSGDRVAIAMTNSLAFLEVLNAAWHAGLTAVPINAKLHQREFAYILDNAGARVCFVNADLGGTISPLVDELPSLECMISADDKAYSSMVEGEPMPLQEVEPGAPAWLFYTSGTTGRPKGATLSHRNLLAMTLNYFSDVDTVSERDNLIHAAPMSHGSGLYALPHLAKGANHVIPESRGFDPAEIASLLTNYAGVTLFLAPTMVVRLLNAPALGQDALTHLKTIIYGGGPMYVEDLLRALDHFGPKLVQIYGQGEAPMTITYLSKAMHMERDHPRYLERLASVGIARTDVEVRIVDSDDRPLSSGEMGEVAVRGDVVMQGYWKNREATEASLRDGWLHTGDIGVMDEDGFLTLKDRSKDVIISGGANIYPREVEEVLVRHEGVLEASVIGRPHPEWGEEVVAFVVLRPGKGASEQELDRLCLDHIARFKRPRHYRFVKALPKNNYGKVLKTKLRARLVTEDE